MLDKREALCAENSNQMVVKWDDIYITAVRSSYKMD